MSDYKNTKLGITASIKENHNHENTGLKLQAQLLAIVDAVKTGGLIFAGVATPQTNPANPDANVFYITTQSGIYTNFGNFNKQNDQITIFTNNPDGTWANKTLSQSITLSDAASSNTLPVTGTAASLLQTVRNSLKWLVEKFNSGGKAPIITEGTSSAYTLADTTITAKTAGVRAFVTFHTANSANATMNVNNTEASKIRFTADIPLAAGQIPLGTTISLVFDGIYWIIECLPPKSGLYRVHVNTEEGSDSNDGDFYNRPVKTLQRAIELAANGALIDIYIPSNVLSLLIPEIIVFNKNLKLKFRGQNTVVIEGGSIGYSRIAFAANNIEIADTGEFNLSDSSLYFSGNLTMPSILYEGENNFVSVAGTLDNSQVDNLLSLKNTVIKADTVTNTGIEVGEGTIFINGSGVITVS